MKTNKLESQGVSGYLGVSLVVSWNVGKILQVKSQKGRKGED